MRNSGRCATRSWLAAVGELLRYNTTLVAMTLNAHEIPLPAGTQPAFPLPQPLPQHLP